MGSLLHALREMDDCSIIRKDGFVQEYWIHPLNRAGHADIPLSVIARLVAAGYLAWVRDGNTEDLVPTPRGQAIIMRYRPLSYRGYSVYPNYLNWLKNADTFREYVTYGC